MTTKENTARIFKAFCDVNRLTILELLKDGEKCGCEILDQMEIQQSTLSHHMKILCEAGIIQSRREGRWSFSSFNKEGIEQAKGILDSVTYTPTE